MSGRDFLLVTGTAAVTSFIAYVAAATLAAPPDVARCGILAKAASATHSMGWVADATEPRETSPKLPAPDTAPPGGAQSTDDPASSAEPGSPASSDAFETQQRMDERFAAFFKEGGADPRALGANAASRFYAEEWHQDWATSHEQGIRKLFATQEDLLDLSPSQVTCRSKNCQVVLAAANGDQVRSFSQKFMRAATRGDLGMQNAVVSYFPDVSSGNLVFYVSENGNTDLFQ